MIERIEYDATVQYQLNGGLHRPNGRAIEWHDGDWAWYLYDQRNRYYGPYAVWGPEWFIHGKQIK